MASLSSVFPLSFCSVIHLSVLLKSPENWFHRTPFWDLQNKAFINWFYLSIIVHLFIHISVSRCVKQKILSHLFLPFSNLFLYFFFHSWFNRLSLICQNYVTYPHSIRYFCHFLLFLQIKFSKSPFTIPILYALRTPYILFFFIYKIKIHTSRVFTSEFIIVCSMFSFFNNFDRKFILILYD